MTKHRMMLREVKEARVLAAMEKVDRSRFVPLDLRAQAYADRALPIGCGQTISQPYVVALMTELLQLRGTEKVLEIGTGSGYQAAVLSHLARDVYSIEIIPKLAARAAATLKDLGIANVHLRVGDGRAGWPEEAPFDAMLAACAPEHVPSALIEQLKPGGRLVIPVGKPGQRQQLMLMSQHDGTLTEQSIIPVSFVPMVGDLS